MSHQSNVTPLRAQVPPRDRETPAGGPTAPPQRAQHPPTGGIPAAPDPAQSTGGNHWQKHPSDYHADIATDHLIQGHFEVDSAKRAEQLAIAQVNATLSLRDAVLEHAAVMRDIRDGKKKVNPS